jgi:phospholipid transport system substrate-binding protein
LARYSFEVLLFSCGYETQVIKGGVLTGMNKKLFIGLGVLILLSVPLVAASAIGPKEHASATIDRVLSILKNKELKKPVRTRERRALIRKEIETIFDFNEMSKRALGTHWPQRTESEKKEFTALFSDLLEKTYIGKIEGYSNEKIFYDEQLMDGDYATLKTRIVTSKNVSIPIVYRFLKSGSSWSVYDVVVEGVSLVSNYRTQFNKIIRTESYQGLVRRMKDKRIGNKAGGGG